MGIFGVNTQFTFTLNSHLAPGFLSSQTVYNLVFDLHKYNVVQHIKIYNPFQNPWIRRLQR